MTHDAILQFSSIRCGWQKVKVFMRECKQTCHILAIERWVCYMLLRSNYLCVSLFVIYLLQVKLQFCSQKLFLLFVVNFTLHKVWNNVRSKMLGRKTAWKGYVTSACWWDFHKESFQNAYTCYNTHLSNFYSKLIKSNCT